MRVKALIINVLLMVTIVFLINPWYIYSQEIKTGEPDKINLAVLNLKAGAGISAGESELISDRLRGELFNTGKANVMERDQMQEILKEQGFQQSGACTDQACLVEMGQMLGVEQLITGSIGKVGSMFMLNVRAIDVRTAKITKVVSKDVKGDIEEMVEELKDVAEEVLGSAKKTAAAPVQVKKEPEEVKAPPEVKKEPPKEEAQAVVAVTEEPKAEEEQEKEEVKEPVDPVKVERNRNRGGVRIEFLLHGSRVTEWWTVDTSDYYSTIGYDTIRIKDYNFDNIQRSPMLGFGVKFGIKAGPLNTVDIGFSFMHQGTTYSREIWDSVSNSYQMKEWIDNFYITGISTGINFVKRWYPMKMNLGVVIDYNMLIFGERTAFNGIIDSFDPEVCFNVAIGPRIGMEILVNPHIGFNMDFQYIFSNFSTMGTEDYVYNSYGTSYTVNTVKHFNMPGTALGTGINFYY